MVISISRKRAAVTADVVARTAASSLEEMARSLDIGANLGLVSVIFRDFTLWFIFLNIFYRLIMQLMICIINITLSFCSETF